MLPTGDLTVPLTEIPSNTASSMGFRESMFEYVEDDGTEVGSMTTTSIAGGDSLIMRYGERHAVVRGRDLFAAWVRQVDPEGAKQLPESVRYAGS